MTAGEAGGTADGGDEEAAFRQGFPAHVAYKVQVDDRPDDGCGGIGCEVEAVGLGRQAEVLDIDEGGNAEVRHVRRCQQGKHGDDDHELTMLRIGDEQAQGFENRDLAPFFSGQGFCEQQDHDEAHQPESCEQVKSAMPGRIGQEETA
nr:hypothetical protein [uncultured Megasphaera sp.]